MGGIVYKLSYLHLVFIILTLVLLRTTEAKIFQKPQKHPIQRYPQGKGLNIWDWLFGNANSTSNASQRNNITTFMEDNNNTQVSMLPKIGMHSNTTQNISTKLTNYTYFHPSNSTNYTTSINTNSTSTNQREGKQLFPGPYFPMPIYTWPWNVPQTPPYQMQKNRQRPVLNINTQDGSSEFDTQENMDMDAEDEQNFEDMIKELREAHRKHKLDKVSIEMESSESTSDNIGNDDIEDYEITDMKDDLNKINQRRSLYKRSLCGGTKCNPAPEQFFGQRWPSSRGQAGVGGMADSITTVTTALPSPSTSINNANTTINPTTAVAVSNSSMNEIVSSTPSLPISTSSSPTPTPMLSKNGDAVLSMLANGTMALPLLNSTMEHIPVNSSETMSPPGNNSLATNSVPSNMTFQNMTEDANTTTTAKPLPSISAVLNCQCGVQSVSNENVGSTLIRVMTHPWIVEIMAKGSHRCAGSLINDNYIMTAASCVDKIDRKFLHVKAGVQLRNQISFAVTKVAIHPKYNPITKANNIALLRLSDRVRSSQNLRPICLPLQPAKNEIHTASLVTWIPKGKRGRNIQLLHTEVELINSTECETRMDAFDENSNMDVVTNGTLCTNPPAQRKCTGDIGGILQVYAGKYSYEQIGIVSTTVGCRTSGVKAVFTDVSHYLRWILFQTQDGNYCREPNAGSFIDT